MKLRNKTNKELQKIVEKDYGIKMSEGEANELGSSLLRISRLALIALARKNSQSNKSNVNKK
ncbi:MAG: hypothetical protein ABSA74_03150 [Candidatus Staskawiczbacteria bacterium]|jgi:hypothetical protein